MKIERLKQYRAKKLWWRRWTHQAAVAAVLRPNRLPEGTEVLLIKRSEHPHDPWSGHMAFPGGRREPGDKRVYATAVRELYEETGLNIEKHGQIYGRLSDIMARPVRWLRRPLVVSPYVFILRREPECYHLDPAEVDEMVWVPLSYLADHANRETMTWQRGKISVQLPCYRFGGYLIWGLTLRMLDEMIKVVGK